MKKITFDEMLEQSDPRYGVPLANVDDLKNIQVPKSEVIAVSDPLVTKHLGDISRKLDQQTKPSQSVVFPSSMRISNPTNFSKDASRIIKAIEGKELKVVMPKVKKEKEEPEKDMLCYKVSDGKEPVTGYQYFGFINPEGGWYILFNDAIENQVRYKFGKDNYQKAWENYANLDYKMYNEAIDEIKD